MQYSVQTQKTTGQWVQVLADNDIRVCTLEKYRQESLHQRARIWDNEHLAIVYPRMKWK